MKFSVLLSVYIKDSHIYLNEAIESVLVNQSIVPSELIIVEDGPLTKQLEEVIEDYMAKFPSIVKVIKLETNKGLGEALRIGIENCNFDLIARMDADDVCDEKRFEKQLNYFIENPNIDLVGGNIVEFFDDISNPKFIRVVPSEISSLKKMIKRRNPINHVSVMFKKSAVIKAGSYKHLAYLEDYYLWVRMLSNKSVIKNINENLVYVRTGNEMFKRRSNNEYIKSWYVLQKHMNELKISNKFDLVINMGFIVGFIYIPPKVKEYVYKILLRKPFN